MLAAAVLGAATLLAARSVLATSASLDALRLSAAAAEVRVGDRLFFDPRFAQFFFARCHGDVNAAVTEGDPAIGELPFRPGRALTSPFRGQSISCRTCHLGDDLVTEEPQAGRTYCDFSARSPVTRRDDGMTTTPRNSPLMVNIDQPREVPMLLHFDGEFASLEDLVIDTLTGRNLGWLPEETAIAKAHVAKVIREDTGTNPRLVTYPGGGGGIPYPVILLGTDTRIPTALQLPQPYRIDVRQASDDEVLPAIAKLIRAYVDSLRFGTANTGRPTPSPYDVFLARNALPRGPQAGESQAAYARRLRDLLAKRPHPTWVTEDDGELELHEQPFQFGATELRGLEIFLRQRGAAHVGNCVACHPPPRFTDDRLHNDGAAQGEYDGILGSGAFARLEVPALAERNAHFDAYLPPSPRHPKASGRFRSAPSKEPAGRADLGAWNVVANPDLPRPQSALTRILCEQLGAAAKGCAPARLLPLTIAYFKTPSIRDLGQSYPYMHSGALPTIEDVLRHYVTMSALARTGKVRNASPELAGIRLEAGDVAPLAAFLRALNEDYQ
ncbi:MAG TPA: hypothetical protein VGK30_12585 [Candidatus Binatia bacterium]